MKGKKLAILISISVVVIAILIAAIYAFNFWNNMDTFGKNTPGPGIANISNLKANKATKKGLYVKIPVGASTESIAELLTKLGVIDNPTVFKFISKMKGYDSKYRAGTFYIAWNMAYFEIMKAFSGMPAVVKVVIPEYMNIYQTAAKLEKAGLVNAKEFLDYSSTVKCNDRFAKYIPESRNPRYEGYLFPATYQFERTVTMKEIVNQMLQAFDTRFTTAKYAKAKAIDMTPDQVVTLASIVEREAANPSEFKTIAGIFINRLKIGMRLQSDATINYYLSKLPDKSVVSGVSFTSIETPYNTYLHDGLTPGPICSPSEQAMDAVLNYEKNDYYYFLAKGDGTSAFSKTYAEHQAAIAQYLR